MRHVFISIFVILSVHLTAQESTTVYSRAKVLLAGHSTSEIAQAGMDLSHGLVVPGRFIICDFANWELARFEEAGFEFEILIEDVQEHYINRTPSAERKLECQEKSYIYQDPEHFTLGSMGGFYTYSEMLDVLDEMAILYPHLISIRQPIGAERTYSGKPIYWLRISDNPDVQEDEPEVLYTALHHAREPISLSQMVYFMWYVLERYDSDPEIKYIVDNTQLYFIPCVNPDGYIYNGSAFPEGGGQWRKNMRDNNNSGAFEEKDDGVDLNRNYDLNWGLDDVGSSSNPGSITYRGIEPFSEPETRAVRDFCNAHDFQIALNYHAFGNFLLHPWGYANVNPDDSLVITAFAEALTHENDFNAGNSLQTLGYPVNGGASDWMYGEDASKPIIFSFTPEIGDGYDGFWPEQSLIPHLCKSSLLKNITAAHLTRKFAIATEHTAPFISGLFGELRIELKRYGIEEGSFQVSVVPLNDNIEEVSGAQTVSLSQFQSKNLVFDFVTASHISHGDEALFLLQINDGSVVRSDTIRKVYGMSELAFSEAGNSTQHWEIAPQTDWGVTTAEYHSAPSSITDSPNGTYRPNAWSYINIKEPLNLDGADEAVLRFWAKWDIEWLLDYVLVQASPNGLSWSNLCGQYTKPGSIFQLENEPLYDEVQETWVQEEIDLADYLGGDLYLRFVLVSDGFQENDGFYFDDLEIQTFAGGTTSTYFYDREQFDFTVSPNPANNQSNVTFELPGSYSEATLVVTDMFGKGLFSSEVQKTGFHTIPLEVSHFTPGLYFCTLRINGKAIYTHRLVVQK